MNSSKILLALPCALAISMLSGCAASVKSGGTEALTIQDSAKRNLVLNLQGTSKVQQNEDWPQLKQEWKEALQYEATCSGLMKPDTLLGENARQIEVSDDQTTPYLFR